ncbi:MAG: short-chain fatty acyl-CoA regulator family protein [Brevundimonas sp.]|uniref:helix-turn-helix domain-containing protein n=1 Tax=Brevundimonas sp. TaxID=1871086 RepID=UPI0039192781
MAETTDRKLYLGGRLRRLRRELDRTQTAMAKELGVSPSYLNHIERNQRPVTAQLLLKLAEVYDIDLRAFGSGPVGNQEAELSEVFADPLFEGLRVPRHEVLGMIEDAPAASEAIGRLYRALLDARRRGQLASERRETTAEPMIETAAEWVRAYVQGRRNHFPQIDLWGEAIHGELSADRVRLETEGLEALMRERLQQRHGLGVRTLPAEVMVEWTRRFDFHRRRLLLVEGLEPATRLFAIAYQLGLGEHGPALDAMADQASPPDLSARRLLKVSLTNTLAAAILMPYGPFHRLAEDSGYDIARLMARFGASFEQVAHRLTTLSRAGASGVPFFFMRVDRAGNVSKRFASDRFPFSRLGGSCPRWRLHGAFAQPGETLTQIIETPEGGRWFTLSRTVQRPGGAAGGGSGRHDLAIGLGCELSHAHRLIHARGLDLENPDVTPIGPACGLCERHPCRERAAPPLTRTLIVDDFAKSISPYPFSSRA